MKINRRHFCSGLAIGATAVAPSTASGQSEDTSNVQLIEADPDAGFNYPYFLYTPRFFTTKEDSPRPILIESISTGKANDDFTIHLQKARNLIIGGRPRKIAERVGIPLLVPVVPRYRKEPQPWWVYVQTLDSETFTIEDSPLKRVDLQLLDMVEDARSRLEVEGHTISSEIHIDGFSASGTFANRFTMLHPERVNAVSSGGNHALTLPKTEIDDDVPVVGDPKWDKITYPVGTEEKELPYPIGVANLEELTGSTFNREAWLNTPQYIYVGSEDNPVPSDGRAYKGFENIYNEQIQQMRPGELPYGMPDLLDDIHGELSIDERWKVSKAVYENVGAAATFTIYEGYGHTSRPAIDDIVEFHRTEIEETYGSISIVEKGISTVEKNPVFTIGATLSGIIGIGYILKLRSEIDS